MWGKSLRKKHEVKPAAFLSYVRFDEKHEDGKLSDLRERLSAEVRAQTGEDFPIFQDRNDIHWGEHWEQRIEKSIDSVTFFIPIITPSFFKSTACRKETKQFLAREKRLKRNDLVLPLYYIELPSETNLRNKDKLVESVFAHQYTDWRELRFELITSVQVSKKIAQMATEIRDAISRHQGVEVRRKKAKKNIKKQARRGTEMGRPDASVTAAIKRVEENQAPLSSSGLPSPQSIVPTHTVSTSGDSDYTRISDAIAAANAGDRIMVRSGLYDETLQIDKSLEIIGDGRLGEVVVRASNHVVLFKAPLGRLANLSLRHTGTNNSEAVNIAQGRLEIEDCEITSDRGTAVAVFGGADPRLRKNRITAPKEFGVMIVADSRGILEDNEILQCGVAGVVVTHGANPTVRRNRIHEIEGSGIHLSSSSTGVFEDNEIFDTALHGITIRKRANPVFRRNRIHNSEAAGVAVRENGLGVLEENEIVDNRICGIDVRGGGHPTVRNNVIKGDEIAISISEGGGGIFEENDLRANTEGSWRISADSIQKVNKSGNLESL